VDYKGWIQAVCTLLEYLIVSPSSATPTGTAFDTIYPNAIDYTELRLQRDLDFLNTIVTDNNAAFVPNQRLQTFPTTYGKFVVVSSIRPITGGTGYGQNAYGSGAYGGGGTAQAPLEFVNRAALDFAWPSDASLGANIGPVQWTVNDGNTFLVGPAPDQAYGFEVVGTQRFVELSATNTTNFLTLNLPDLYVTLSMRWFADYQRDPDLVKSYDMQYQEMLQSAAVEEARKKYADMFPRQTKPTAGLKAA
jgi:hypothetical protein